MPFITQGKTNWKFLLIVIILAVIVGRGALWCYLRFQEIKFLPIQPEKKVTITTDKTEYEQRELIKITVRNGLDIPILYYNSERFWGIEYLEDEEWKNPEYERGGGFQLTEENINDICSIRLYERMPPVEMKSYSTLSQQWNQRICPFGEGDPGEPRFVKYIGTGRYRLIFYYGFEISNEDPYKISSQKTIYSNEFTIKEKIDETADWKTYTASKMKFSMRVPPNWETSEDENILTEGTDTDFDTVFNYFDESDNHYHTNLTIIKSPLTAEAIKDLEQNEEETTFEKLASAYKKNSIQDYWGVKDITEKKITLDGITFAEFCGIAEKHKYNLCFLIGVRKNDVFGFECLSEAQECDSTFNQMLSTFKFLE